jgi:hypothetical protein
MGGDDEFQFNDGIGGSCVDNHSVAGTSKIAKPFEEEDWNDEIDTQSKLKEALRAVLRAKLYEQVQDKDTVKTWVE